MERNLQNEEDTIDLLELLYVLYRKIGIIIAACIAGIALMAAYTLFFVTPMYEATSMLYILTSSNSIISVSDLQLGTQLTSDYAILIKTRPVLETVIEDLELDMTATELKDLITIDNPSSSRVLTITVTHPVPQTAQNLANELAEVTAKRMAEVMMTDEPTIAENAILPTSPSSPNVAKNCILGGLVGAVAAMAVIIALYLLDDTIKSQEDIEKYLQISTLAVIPKKDGTPKKGKRRRKTAKGRAKKND
jgi:capsular polysaccharide biosynthesis protein